ncbi:MAG: cyclase family protein [Chloroflexi bacterium]|nr:cyclase family protein [Chloroflexota bacterium]OJV89272.1 MAG: cyclase [Chloroflexi bacterium 54-19]
MSEQTKRVVFDFEIDFTNGGGIQGQHFRLDIAGNDISDRELADYIVQDMRLLMVGEVRILNKQIITEPHKRVPINTSTESAGALIDLSHTIRDGLVTYKGLPAPVICDYLSREESRSRYAPGTEFQIGKIEMVSNTGTYLDSPFHRFEGGADLAALRLENLANLDGIVVRASSGDLAVGLEYFKNKEIRGRAVLVHTGWDKHWNTPAYYDNHPFLTAEAADYLAKAGVRLVGIDSHNIDDTRPRTRPVHTALLGAGILIVEHLTRLELLPDEGFKFSAVPPKFEGVGTFPVRAFAERI